MYKSVSHVEKETIQECRMPNKLIDLTVITQPVREWEDSKSWSAVRTNIFASVSVSYIPW